MNSRAKGKSIEREAASRPLTNGSNGDRREEFRRMVLESESIEQAEAEMRHLQDRALAGDINAAAVWLDLASGDSTHNVGDERE